MHHLYECHQQVISNDRKQSSPPEHTALLVHTDTVVTPPALKSACWAQNMIELVANSSGVVSSLRNANVML